MAEPEKAIIDYLYLGSQLNTPEDLSALRFNTTAINEKMNWKKLALYAEVFYSATLNTALINLSSSNLNKLAVHRVFIS